MTRFAVPAALRLPLHVTFTGKGQNAGKTDSGGKTLTEGVHIRQVYKTTVGQQYARKNGYPLADLRPFLTSMQRGREATRPKGRVSPMAEPWGKDSNTKRRTN